MKILNLYAGIGGNRKLWGDEHEVTAVEIDEEIAGIYKGSFPKDKVVVGDAHEYLLSHYKEFDFIWASPPCPTHSITNYFLNAQGTIRYPDMKLYEEILFLKGYFKGKFVIENVISWYEPLIKPYIYMEHYYWSNFIINGKESADRKHEATVEEKQKLKGFDLSNYKGIDKQKILRNCVEPNAGLEILKMAFKEKQQRLL